MNQDLVTCKKLRMITLNYFYDIFLIFNHKTNNNLSNILRFKTWFKQVLKIRKQQKKWQKVFIGEILYRLRENKTLSQKFKKNI